VLLYGPIVFRWTSFPHHLQGDVKNIKLTAQNAAHQIDLLVKTIKRGVKGLRHGAFVCASLLGTMKKQQPAPNLL